MVALLIVLIAVAALATASLLGWVADSRDGDFDLGRLSVRPRQLHQHAG